MIPYISDEQAEAATKNAQLKLMFRLVKFFILDEGEFVSGPVSPSGATARYPHPHETPQDSSISFLMKMKRRLDLTGLLTLRAFICLFL